MRADTGHKDQPNTRNYRQFQPVRIDIEITGGDGAGCTQREGGERKKREQKNPLSISSDYAIFNQTPAGMSVKCDTFRSVLITKPTRQEHVLDESAVRIPAVASKLTRCAAAGKITLQRGRAGNTNQPPAGMTDGNGN